MNHPRIQKPGERLMADLESQVKFLREALRALRTERDRYKQVASTLRVLVCGFSRNRPLLLDIMDELGVQYWISPIPELPFPLPMENDALDNDAPDVDFSGMSTEEISAFHRKHCRSYPLREFVQRGLAVHVSGRSYSYATLIRTLAEQCGGAHEDWTIDPNIPELESFIIGDFEAQVAPLCVLAEHVIDASVMVVNKAATLGYQPHYFVRGAGAYELPGVGD